MEARHTAEQIQEEEEEEEEEEPSFRCCAHKINVAI